MTLQFSPDKKRVLCPGCRQFQPVLTQRRDGDMTLVCGACLHGISQQPDDLEAARGMAARELPERETVAWLTDSGKAACAAKGGKNLPEPTVETRPAQNEGTR